jgi:hypothetical protein
VEGVPADEPAVCGAYQRVADGNGAFRMIGAIGKIFGFKAKSALQPEEEIAASAASFAVLSLLTQLMMVALRNVAEEPVTLDSPAGSEAPIAYIIGFSKVVHKHFESNSGQFIHDGSMTLAVLGSVFSLNSMEECSAAYEASITALDSDKSGVRDAFVLGKDDAIATLNGAASVSGLISILGVGTL